MPSRADIEELLRKPQVTDQELRTLGSGAVATLVEILHAEHEGWADDLLAGALRALGAIGSKAATAALIAASDDPGVPAWLRRAALRELGACNRPEAVQHLAAKLADPDFAVAKSAAAGLARSPRLAARAALEAARDGANPDLAAVARELLGEMPPPDDTEPSYEV